jgi:tetratricopeptide (TPR) repeat protein
MMRTALALVLLLALAPRAEAQRDAMARAFDLERRGDLAGAADAYLEVLRQRPEDLSALLGLERALTPLHRQAELVRPVRALLARTPDAGTAYSVGLRAWAAAGESDSVAAMAERWARLEPTEEAPYRDWGSVLLEQRDRAGAHKAYISGRERLGRPAALAPELAQLAVADGDYEIAAREWLLAIGELVGYKVAATTSLARTPPPKQADVLRQLEKSPGIGRRLAAELRARWGDPVAGYALLVTEMPSANPAALDALRQFLDAMRFAEGKTAQKVRGQTLEDMAARSLGASAARTRLEAARAYADGGDPAAARRMLALLAGDRAAPPQLAASAAATLVGVLVDEGDVAEAERRLSQLGGTFDAEERGALQRRVAWGWIRKGALDRAETLVSIDSTVEGLALAGRIRVFRGDLHGAADLLRSAGPYAGTREDATARTALLALIQPIEQDSLPELGEALLALEQGDTARAVRGLENVAGELPPAGGGAELYLWAGRVEAVRGRITDAERLLRLASAPDAPATAPAAELELARLLLTVGRTTEATGLLEHLILAWPGSAVVPQARRLLDAIRGGVPQT